ncbi:MAG: tRNA uridine-5-carboxymethylaminomethyl(34) synthesis GTPase MnmE [Candidatus Omnitrophica bacterium]|nr:tRNA uridine-5-carboxymethylaminomethyl(34) synthesis GTPase MnmE [Candidatus Omnitrophota bacterium]
MNEPNLLVQEYNRHDTICAIATFPAKAALGVIKVSGKNALGIVAKIFRPKVKKNIRRARNFSLHYGWIVEKSKIKNKKLKIKGQETRVVDEVLVSVMRKPFSYTREDVVEISSHGGGLVLNKILDLLVSSGGRAALPGEFTYRAFIHGRIDLLQAQSIVDIVEAKTDFGLAAAVAQLKGANSRKIEKLKTHIEDFLVKVEAILEFPEEHIPVDSSQITRDLNMIKETVTGLRKDAERAERVRGDIHCVICGRANVGKSTLFNRLLRQERVIVTRIPGTTRDVIQEDIYIRGVALKMYDTAGILEPKDLIDKKAIEKSKDKIKDADLILLVIDQSQKIGKDDRFLLDMMKGKNAIVVLNKADLPQKIDMNILKKLHISMVKMSALKDQGLSTLEDTIAGWVKRKGLTKDEDLLFLAQWQRTLLTQIEEEIAKALEFHRNGYPLDHIHFSLQEVFRKIGVCTGQSLNDEVMNKLFTQFCIGK